ncbi:MAG: HEAT repeat domain-containing protein [Planctomycetes bacterium]|nr:HEAT repeat domain-containing protein [Planctomycetota bacterium]
MATLGKPVFAVLAAALALAVAEATYAQIDMGTTNAFGSGTMGATTGGSSALGSSAFGSSAFGSSNLGSSSFDTQTFSSGGRLQTRPGTSAITGATAAGRGAASGSPAGPVPTLFLRDPKEISAILAATDLTPVTPADPAVVKDIVSSLAGSDAAKKSAAERRLTELGRSAVVPLAHLVQQAQIPEAERSAAVRALVQIGPAAVPMLVSMAREPAPEVRLAAVRSLATIGNRVGLKAMTDALEDRESSVRQAAAEGLGAMKQPMSGVALAKALMKDLSVDVRVAAAEALGKVESRAAVEPLITGLFDSQPRVRQASARALASLAGLLASGERGEVGRGKVVEALAMALSDKDLSVRVTAADGLAVLGDGRAVERLATLLEDPQARPAAVRALGRIGGAVTRAHLEKVAAEAKDADVRRAAQEAMPAAPNP